MGPFYSFALPTLPALPPSGSSINFSNACAMASAWSGRTPEPGSAAMRRIVAMRSGWVLSTIRLNVSSLWQRAQRTTKREAAIRSNSRGDILAPGFTYPHLRKVSQIRCPLPHSSRH